MLQLGIMKTLRLFALLDQLRLARHPVSAGALAATLEVSPRTIYRDIASLQAMGAPIRGESGLGYQLEPGYFLPPLQFDPDELEAIMLGLRLVIARDGGGLRGPAQRVAGKVATAMGAGAGTPFHDLPLRAVTRAREADALAGVWTAPLRAAIRSRAVLELTYRPPQGPQTRRRIRPLGLTLFDEVWLLTAWCETRDDFRNFRLDRIAALVPVGTRFRLQPGQRFEDYLTSL